MDTRTTTKFKYFGKDALAGGLNVADNPLIISPAEMTVADNILQSATLARKKRPGVDDYNLDTDPFSFDGDPVAGVVHYQRFVSGAFTDSIVVRVGTKLYNIATRNTGDTDITGAATLSATGIPSFQVFEGILYFTSTDPADDYYKWDGTSASPGDIAAATPPGDGPGKYLGTWRGRMIMAGNADFPYRVYISAPYDGDKWEIADGGTSLDLAYDGDAGITAIFPELDGALYIATRTSLWQITADDPNEVGTYRVKRITPGVGCLGHRTVVATANDILFCSDRGVHSLRKVIVSDQSNITFLSKSIQPIFTSLLNPTTTKQYQARWEENLNLYVLTVTSAGQLTNDSILAYNVDFGYWTVWPGCGARSLCTVLIGSKSYIMAGTEDGRLGYFNPAIQTDFGAGFSARFRTGKLFPGGDITSQKLFKAITIMASSTKVSAISVSWTIDSIDGTRTGTHAFSYGQGSDLLGSTLVLGAGHLGIGQFLPNRTSIDNVGYNIQIEIAVTGESDIEFYGFVLEVEDVEDFSS